MEEFEYRDIISLIYNEQENVIDERIKQANKKTREKIKNINIENIMKNTSKPSEIKKILAEIEENYSIKISEYNKQMYRQGFIDGVNLIINCRD